MSIDESKISTELNLALNTPEDERDKALDLNVGYDPDEDEWELIIKYTGELGKIASDVGFTLYTELLGGYGVVVVGSSAIDALSKHPQIIFIEKPKSLHTERVGNITGFSQSCMNEVTTGALNLTGRGIVVCVIDSGIDIMHEDFRRDGSSKILEIWDQTQPGNPPNGYLIGSVYTRDDINSVVFGNESEAAAININTYDVSGHGTGVASVVTACVPEADLLIIKLAETFGTNAGGFPRTTTLMLGIDYAVRRSMTLNVPMVINLSFGNNYGDHASNSVLEDYIDTVSGLSRLVFVTGMGNDGNSGRHAELDLKNDRTQQNNQVEQVEFQVGNYEAGINLQVWKSYSDDIDIFMIIPDGRTIGPFNLYQEVMYYNLIDMNIRVINGYPTPINLNQETYISIIPKQEYIQSGIWKLVFVPRSINNGRVDVWLPVAGSTTSDVRFISPTVNTSMTIPATARNVISTGAYNPLTLTYASFSGRGYTADNEVKPDLTAPGVDIDVAAVGGGYVRVSGTSFAAPFVSAGAAMLMEWGIVMNNDPFLYGDKVKAYLISGARPLPGEVNLPNERIGHGALCVVDSLPRG